MGITTAMMDGFSKVIRTLEPTAKPHILFLGYQDIVVTDQYFKTNFGEKSAVLVPRKDSAEVIKHHGVNANLVKSVPTLSSFMKLYGDFDVSVFDFEKVEGSEEIVDLNLPIDKRYRHRFDIIIDTGTIEHIFNIGEAIKNIAVALKKGGLVWHGSPLLFFNHGFYNLNPTFFVDFYSQNGFEILDLCASFHRDGEFTILPVDGTGAFTVPLPPRRGVFHIPILGDLMIRRLSANRVGDVPSGFYGLFCLAKNIAGIDRPCIPIQAPYRAK